MPDAPNLGDGLVGANARAPAAALLIWMAIAGRAVPVPQTEPTPTRRPDPRQDASLVLHVTGPDGSALEHTGTCHILLTDLSRGTPLQPPVDSLAIAFIDGARVPSIGVFTGIYDVWIDVPGFAWFVTTVTIEDVCHLHAQLERPGRIRIRAGDVVEGASSEFDVELRPMRVASPGASYTHFRGSLNSGESNTWERLPAGVYQLEAEYSAASSVAESRDVVSRLVQQVALATGEDVQLVVPRRNTSTGYSEIARGEICIPESWWAGCPNLEVPQVTLFDSRGGSSVWRRASVRRRGSSACDDSRTFVWTVRGCPPGRYLMRVDPVNFWAEVHVGGSDANERIVVGEPSLLSVRLVESRGGIQRDAIITDVGPIGPLAQFERYRRATARAIANVGTVLVARGQHLRVISRANGDDVLQESEAYVDWPEVSVEPVIGHERVVHVRLLVDGQRAPRSLAWWTQNAPPRSIGSEDRLLWSAASISGGGVEYRFACDAPVQVEFDSASSTIQAVTPEVSRARVAPIEVELRVTGQ